MRKEIEAAGIPFQDAQGRRADFHSLRGTLNTRIAGKVDPQMRQKIMRHSGIKLALDSYTDLTLLEKRGMDARLRLPKQVSLLELQRSASHILLEEFGEGTLVAKAKGPRDFADRHIFPLQHFTSGLDAELREEGLRIRCERFHELPVKLPGRNMHCVREFLDRNARAEVLPDVSDGTVQLQVAMQDFAALLIRM